MQWFIVPIIIYCFRYKTYTNNIRITYPSPKRERRDTSYQYTGICILYSCIECFLLFWYTLVLIVLLYSINYIYIIIFTCTFVQVIYRVCLILTAYTTHIRLIGNWLSINNMTGHAWRHIELLQNDIKYSITFDTRVGKCLLQS